MPALIVYARRAMDLKPPTMEQLGRALVSLGSVILELERTETMTKAQRQKELESTLAQFVSMIPPHMREAGRAFAASFSHAGRAEDGVTKWLALAGMALEFRRMLRDDGRHKVAVEMTDAALKGMRATARIPDDQENK